MPGIQSGHSSYSAVIWQKVDFSGVGALKIFRGGN
jgi:hypothetical protein